ncbi:MAG: twin-arginine translocation signal domain-containing protein, partial [Coriobacteriales bacterium]|nr:twin-arginine translocation signal domain-containing protein [Coriobacteriales bacterium]
MKDQDLSRRDFIKGAAIAATGAAALGLAGCDNSSSGGSLPTSWDKEVDVVVCGAGVGMVAGIEATTAGADVLILEAGDHVGGLWITAGGSCTMGGNNVV